MSEQKKLYRSRKNKMIGGVCGGLGEYLNIDPTIVRIIYALITLMTCLTGLVAYIVFAIIIPEEPV